MKHFVAIGACVAFVATAVPAAAQARRPERPFRGLFASNADGPPRGQKLKLRASLFGSYDDNALAGQGQNPTVLGRAQTDGYYTGLNASLEYQRVGRKLSVGSEAGANGRYYATLKSLNALNPFANIFVNAVLNKTTISGRQQVEYSPYYSLSFLPGLAAADSDLGGGIRPAPDVAIQERQAYVLDTALTVTQALTTRDSIIATYHLSRRDFKQRSETDLSSVLGSATYRHQISRYAALRLGYGLQQANYRGANSADPRVRLHLLDVGADYRRPLSFSRRTLVDFKLGSTVAEGGLVGDRVYRMIADAGLVHEIGRTWELKGTYHRGAGLVEGLTEPTFSDSALVKLGGFVNRRLELALDAAYTEGEIGLTGERNPFDSISANARMQAALTSRVAVFADYLYYHYRFDATYALPVGLPRDVDRQGVRAGLTLLLPILK